MTFEMRVCFNILIISVTVFLLENFINLISHVVSGANCILMSCDMKQWLYELNMIAFTLNEYEHV